MLCLLSRSVLPMKRAAMTLQRNCVPLATLRHLFVRVVALGSIPYIDAASSTNGQAAKMCPQLKKWVGGLRDPDSSPFTLVWTHISWLSSLVQAGKAATICQECRLVKSAFWVLGSGRIRLALTTEVGENSALSHNASCKQETW